MHWEWPSIWHLARTSGGALRFYECSVTCAEAQAKATETFDSRTRLCRYYLTFLLEVRVLLR
jgi:hypothetical protein